MLLFASAASHPEVGVVDFCQIPCLNGGRCIGRDECWCPANSTGKFCHLPAPRLDQEPPERGPRHRAPLEGPLKQSTFTLPLSNQLGECGAGEPRGVGAGILIEEMGNGVSSTSFSSILRAQFRSLNFSLPFLLSSSIYLFMCFFCPYPLLGAMSKTKESKGRVLTLRNPWVLDSRGKMPLLLGAK